MNKTTSKKQLEVILNHANALLMTYRAIDALNVLKPALDMVEGKGVTWQLKSAVYHDMGQALYQQGRFEDAMHFFIQSYEVAEDGNDKAAVANLIAGYYFQEGDTAAARDYAEKALATATASELMSRPYQIKGTIALEEGDYPKALELMNKAASLAEESHCITDLAMVILDISVVYMKMGHKATALSEVYRAERYVKESHNLDLYMRCAIRRAKILYLMGKDEEAKRLVCSLDEQKC